MKSLYITIVFTVAIFSLILSGCDLLTKEPDPERAGPRGQNLTFTEVFTLPPDRFYTYSWIEVYNSTTRPFDWYREVYPAIVFLVGKGPVAAYSSNDGNTWQEVDLGISEESIMKGVVFPWPDTGIVVGTEGQILRVIRSNNTFDPQPVPEANKPADLRKKSLNDITGGLQNPSAWACGDSGIIIRTLNYGRDWRPYYSPQPPTTQRLNAIEFQTFQALYCVGDSGTLLKSPRANAWDKMTPPDTYEKTNFYGVKFINADTGFVVGENGSIIFTFTGGNVWVSQTSGTTEALRDVYFSNEYNYNRYTVWAVGDNGTILKTTNLGETWAKIDAGYSVNLRVVTFIDSLRGGAFGDAGTVLVSGSAGEDWMSVDLRINMDDIYAAYYFPPTVYERDYYTMQYRAKRKAFFFDLITRTVNYSVFTKIDTGTIIYNPFTQLSPLFFGLFPFQTVKSIPTGGFTVINNDSIKFTTHHKLGPGQTSVLNASVAFYPDSSVIGGMRPVLWDLLSSGEIRLVNHHERYDLFTQRFLEYTQNTVDLVRWGNYMPAPEDFFGDSLYLNNEPLGYIPEWYSIARYADDVGVKDLNTLSTKNSFYFSKDPIPGWYSQKRK